MSLARHTPGHRSGLLLIRATNKLTRSCPVRPSMFALTMHTRDSKSHRRNHARSGIRGKRPLQLRTKWTIWLSKSPRTCPYIAVSPYGPLGGASGASASIVNIELTVSKVNAYSSSQTPRCYGNSRAIWDHTVLPATRQRWHSRLYPSRLRLVLDLATPEGCKAELT